MHVAQAIVGQDMKIYLNEINNNVWPVWDEFKIPAGLDIDLSLFECHDLSVPDLCEEPSFIKEAVSKIPEIKRKNIQKAKTKRRKRKSLTGLSRKRREANARERRRVEELNRGFVYLKKALPLPSVDISKLEILRLALKWIDHLETMLENYNDQRELLTIKQMETSRPEDLLNINEGVTPAKHACQYHEFPNLQNTLWEESIGLQQGKILRLLVFFPYHFIA
jgi:hypothetical protein